MTNNDKSQMSNDQCQIGALRVPTSPCPRVPVSPRPRVSVSPPPRVPVSPRPGVPASPRLRVPASRRPRVSVSPRPIPSSPLRARRPTIRELLSNSPSDFFGTDRFNIRRRLGSGGMGVVFEAHDRETDKVVALKALTRTEASHISRFKTEFRSLANVSHPNLVSLYELMSDGQYWFFTMELVQGVNFLEYVRPGYRARRSNNQSLTNTLLKTGPDETQRFVANFEAETEELIFNRVTLPDDAFPESFPDI